MPQLFLLHYITQCHFHFSGSKIARHMYVTNHVQITSLLTYKIIMPDQGRRDQGDRGEIAPPPKILPDTLALFLSGGGGRFSPSITSRSKS